MVSPSILQEFAQLLQNAVRIEDDWCQDYLVYSLKIVPVLLFLCNYDGNTNETVLAALDCIEQVIEFNEGYEERAADIKEHILESSDPLSHSTGLTTLETLALHENEHIREQAQDILEDKFDHFLGAAFENVIEMDDVYTDCFKKQGELAGHTNPSSKEIMIKMSDSVLPP